MADAGDLYDEFGNYIGPELSESEEVGGGVQYAGRRRAAAARSRMFAAAFVNGAEAQLHAGLLPEHASACADPRRLSAVLLCVCPCPALQEEEELQQQAEEEGMAEEADEDEEAGAEAMEEDRMPGTDLALYGELRARWLSWAGHPGHTHTDHRLCSAGGAAARCSAPAASHHTMRC